MTLYSWNVQIFTSLSSPHPCKSMQGFGTDLDYDLRDKPSGHLAVLHEYSRETQKAYIADIIKTNPTGNEIIYGVSIGAMIFVSVTYDTNLIIINPKDERT